MPALPILHRDAHDHHTRTIAMASWGAGLVVGTAAGAILFGGRHAATPEEAPPEAASGHASPAEMACPETAPPGVA